MKINNGVLVEVFDSDIEKQYDAVLGKNCHMVVIPDGVRRISGGVFYYADLVESVVIPRTVTTIKPHAFTETVIKHLSIPTEVKTVEPASCFGCPKLKTVTYNGVTYNLETDKGDKREFAVCDGVFCILPNERNKYCSFFYKGKAYSYFLPFDKFRGLDELSFSNVVKKFKRYRSEKLDTAVRINPQLNYSNNEKASKREWDSLFKEEKSPNKPANKPAGNGSVRANALKVLEEIKRKRKARTIMKGDSKVSFADLKKQKEIQSLNSQIALTQNKRLRDELIARLAKITEEQKSVQKTNYEPDPYERDVEPVQNLFREKKSNEKSNEPSFITDIKEFKNIVINIAEIGRGNGKMIDLV